MKINLHIKKRKKILEIQKKNSKTKIQKKLEDFNFPPKKKEKKKIYKN
jgi:hypothetical protein